VSITNRKQIARKVSISNKKAGDLRRIGINLIRNSIQSDSGGICNTSVNDSICDSKQKVHMNMGLILNGYRDMVKRTYGPSCEHEQQLRNK